MKVVKFLFFIPFYLFQVAILIICFFPGFFYFMEDTKGRKGADPLDFGAYINYYWEGKLFQFLLKLEDFWKRFINIAIYAVVIYFYFFA